MKSKWGDGNYLFYRPEAMEPLKREELISKINIDLLQDRCYLYTAVKHFLEERGIRIKPSDYNEDMKESLFLEEMLPEWVEVYDIGFLQNIFASAPAGTKQEKLEWCKQEVLRLFRYETKPPEWMTIKEMILDCLSQDDEAFTQILEYFELAVGIKITPFEVKKILAEMVEEGYIYINRNWKNEHDEFPYSLTEKGRNAWEEIDINTEE